ncbi:UNVERIFIED_CONTAM: Pentatricopeptide repeat-containing protein, mitochondrial [Sesamum indicum]
MVKPSEAEKNLVQSNTSAGGAGVAGRYGATDRKLYVGNLHFNMTQFQLKRSMGSFKQRWIILFGFQACCTHAGLLEKGWEVFNLMSNTYSIDPGLDHYACITDLLGHRGKLKEALEFIQDMPIKPDSGIWGTLLSACKIHHNLEIAEHAAYHLLQLEPHAAAPYVEMANIYASARDWNGVAVMRIRK